MLRIDSANARPDVNGQGKAGFHDNADLPGQDPTYLNPTWCNAVQEEILNVVEFAGLTPSSQHNDLLEAIQALQRQNLAVAAEAIFPVGSWHGTDATTYDPAQALETLFGRRTVWRLRPYAPYGVSSSNEALLRQISFTAASGANRASTSRIWKRMQDSYQDPNLNLTASASTVNEGDVITFTLNASNLAVNEQVAWVIGGNVDANDISPANMFGYFTVPASGVATYQLTVRKDAKTEGTETLRFSLLDHPDVAASVVINDTSLRVVHPANNEDMGTRYEPGEYEILIQPGEYKRFVLIGGGGGGGAARYSQNNTAYPLSDGQKGESTLVKLQTNVISEAVGGSGGTQGAWNNGSAYVNGRAGGAGITFIDRNTFYSTRSIGGQVGSATMQSQVGGSAIYPGHESGAGGAGAVGVGSSGGVSGYGFGGGGGSGAAVDLVWFNSGTTALVVTLVVGAGGAGGDIGSSSSDVVGSAGIDGVAFVNTLMQV